MDVSVPPPVLAERIGGGTVFRDECGIDPRGVSYMGKEPAFGKDALLSSKMG